MSDQPVGPCGDDGRVDDIDQRRQPDDVHGFDQGDDDFTQEQEDESA